jgi:hypothetical protein
MEFLGFGSYSFIILIIMAWFCPKKNVIKATEEEGIDEYNSKFNKKHRDRLRMKGMGPTAFQDSIGIYVRHA